METSYRNEDALVLLSGGQDSTTSLFWAKKNFRSVSCLSFYYAQKHSAEIDCAKKICSSLSLDLKIADISFIADYVVSGLLDTGRRIGDDAHPFADNVPSSFVPYRNLFFLVLASAWASTLGVRHIVIGVCETDYSGYADCRDIFIKSAQTTLNLATDFKDRNVVIHTPLMWLTKAETFRLAEELGCLDLVITETLTCYNSETAMHPYGRGCGTCPACRLRKKGFEQYVEKYGGKK
ncbi:MAG: 7-cyano-7-deazaguanine synthase QueC [Spirochaetales bacterium]|nr:7-cyano-7-deazaguanine synthase QueC [Spirochaetales bacterium]